MENRESLRKQISIFPEKPGVYQFYDIREKIIYIGKAKNLKKRVYSYFSKPEHENKKTELLLRKVSIIKLIVVENEQDALLLENNLIKKYQPRYNVLLKDDKTYPWICIKKERFSRIFQTRNLIKDGSEYFGPYSSYPMMKTMIDLIRQLFKYRTCKLNLTKKNIDENKLKVCLEYHIGNCLAPCIGLQSDESYNETIKNIANLLRGNLHEVSNSLKKIMKKYSEEYKFEEAQIVKDKIDILENYKGKSTIVNSKINNVDVFNIINDENEAFVNFIKIINGAIIQSHTVEVKKKMNETSEEILQLAITDIREKFNSISKDIIVPIKIEKNWLNVNIIIPKLGDKKRLLDLSFRNLMYFKQDKLNKSLTNISKEKKNVLIQLMDDLQLKEYPRKIECFDISNIQGTNIVASCIVFINGLPKNSEYRHYNIKSTEGQNDFLSMQEVVERRYKRLITENIELPQLVIIDGGKGQLNSAIKSLKKLNLNGKIPIIGLAKKLEEIYYPGDKYPIYLKKTSTSLRLIQKIRNEAHRFVIEFHRNKRSKSSIISKLDKIKGIGPKTKQKLLVNFKSIEKIKNAPQEEIEKIIGNKYSQILFKFLNKV